MCRDHHYSRTTQDKRDRRPLHRPVQSMDARDLQKTAERKAYEEQLMAKLERKVANDIQEMEKDPYYKRVF